MEIVIHYMSAGIQLVTKKGTKILLVVLMHAERQRIINKKWASVEQLDAA